MGGEELLTKTEVKHRYGLTDALIGRIGLPDAYATNTHGRWAAPAQLFSCTRVERWIAGYPAEVAVSARRRAAARQGTETRRAAARQGTETRRAAARAEVARLLDELVMHPVPSRRTLIQEAREYLYMRHADFDGFVSERALRAHLRHEYTNYDQICATLIGKVGTADLYWTVRQALDERIDDEYCDVLQLPRCKKTDVHHEQPPAAEPAKE